MAYENPGAGALEYFPCRYGSSKLLFRGPKCRLDMPYIAVLGGTETYGKFVARPYPALLEEALGHPVVNLGCVNAGLDVFLNEQAILDVCAGAELTVIQLPGAQNLSNRFYAVHPRRNDRFLRASNLLKTIYREVDFTEFNFTRHLLATLREASATKFEMVEQELKEAWLARMKSLISAIDGRIVLLWLADHAPAARPPFGPEATDPLLVSREMIDTLRPQVTAVIEVVASQSDISLGRDEMMFSELERPAARELLGVEAHRKAAAVLSKMLRPLL